MLTKLFDYLFMGSWSETDQSPSDFLTEDAICKSNEPINLDAVSEGLRQAENRMTDTLETMRNLENKITIVAGIYITLFFGLPELMEEKNVVSITVLILAQISLMVGMVFLFCSLLGKKYGVLGRLPSDYLRSCILYGDEDSLAKNQACILHRYEESIKINNRNNEGKAKGLERSLKCAIPVGLLYFIISFWGYWS